MKKNNWSGERLETFIQNRDTIDHLHRYAIAMEYTAGKTILDIASGEGYGTSLMSQTAAFAYGVDIDADAIARARTKYVRPNLEFREGRADAIPLEDHSVDVLISFETLEHHDKHQEMMLEVRRVLKPGGLMLISTPDKKYYTDQRKSFKNEFHVKELYKEEFRTLVSAHFAHSQMLSQTYINGISLIRDEAASAQKIYGGNFDALHFPELPALYLVMIASDSPFEPQPQTIFEGSVVLDKAMAQTYTQSASYRIGHFLLSPVRWFKALRR